jgi:hypothetical protein
MRRTVLLMAGVTWLCLGCGDGGTGPAPNNDGQRLAAQFERLADSVDAGGYSPAGEALRHAAEIVRLTGHATPVNLTLDGSARNFLAVAEQIDFPNLVCSWPSDSGVAPPPDTISVPPPDTVLVPPDTLPGPPDTLPAPPPPDTVPLPPDSSGTVPPNGGGGTPRDSVWPTEPAECTVAGTYSMRTLIAWEPEHMNEVVRIVADVGSNGVATGVPDVMSNLPTTVASDQPGGSAPPDSTPSGGGGSGGNGGGVGGYPGFMGEYLVRDQESWYAVEGTQANVLEEVSGACTDDKATFDWAEFSCEAARLRFEFSMRVEPWPYERLTGTADPPSGAEGSHTLAMASNQVDGVRLTWTAWTPPPMPPTPEPGPIPVD